MFENAIVPIFVLKNQDYIIFEHIFDLFLSDIVGLFLKPPYRDYTKKPIYYSPDQ